MDISTILKDSAPKLLKIEDIRYKLLSAGIVSFCLTRQKSNSFFISRQKYTVMINDITSAILNVISKKLAFIVEPIKSS